MVNTESYRNLWAETGHRTKKCTASVQPEKKGLRSTKGSCAKANLDDEVQVVLSLVQEQNFVKAEFLDSDKPPCVILYDDRQIIDLKRFCTSAHQSALGINRTFNLGKCFVTVTTYKYTDAMRNRTSEPPVIMGPTYCTGMQQ